MSNPSRTPQMAKKSRDDDMTSTTEGLKEAVARLGAIGLSLGRGEPYTIHSGSAFHDDLRLLIALIGSSPLSTGLDEEGAASKRLSHDAERRILDYLRDGDVDNRDSLHSDVQRLYQEMLTWRIACQRWTPGGSEYMDPAYCVQFIERERRIATLNKVELAQFRKLSPAPATVLSGGDMSSVAESALSLHGDSTETEGH